MLRAVKWVFVNCNEGISQIFMGKVSRYCEKRLGKTRKLDVSVYKWAVCDRAIEVRITGNKNRSVRFIYARGIPLIISIRNWCLRGLIDNWKRFSKEFFRKYFLLFFFWYPLNLCMMKIFIQRKYNLNRGALHSGNTVCPVPVILGNNSIILVILVIIGNTCDRCNNSNFSFLGVQNPSI